MTSRPAKEAKQSNNTPGQTAECQLERHSSVLHATHKKKLFTTENQVSASGCNTFILTLK